MPATIEIQTGLTGVSLTLSAFPEGSDTAAFTGESLTEATNRKGCFSYSNASATGLHKLILFNGSSPQWFAWAVLATSGTVVSSDTREGALLNSGIGTDGKIAKVGTVDQTTFNSDKTGYGLADGSITTAKIADGAITDAKIGSEIARQSKLDTLESRLTATRAGYLDKLNVSGTLAHTENADSFKADVSDLALESSVAALGSPLQADDYSSPPTAIAIAGQVRTELTTELGRIDAAVSTRAVPGSKMDLVDSPNSSARLSISASVWANGTRSLTTFGSLIADVASSVWASAARTLTAFGFDIEADVSEESLRAAMQLEDGQRVATPDDVRVTAVLSPTTVHGVPDIIEDTIFLRTGDRSAYRIERVQASTGDDIDLSGFGELQLCIDRADKTSVEVLDVTIINDGAGFSFAPDVAVELPALPPRQHFWALREPGNGNRAIAGGPCIVRYFAGGDV